MQSQAYDFFRAYLARDPETLNTVYTMNLNGLMPSDDALIFSLVALHTILDPLQETPYAQFRNALYKGSLNQDLFRIGAKIELYRSSGKTDANLYRLVRLNP